MTRAELLMTAWYEAHQELRTFMRPYCDEEIGRRLASTAFALWTGLAADGYQPKVGPYGQLFASCYAAAKPVLGTMLLDDDVAIEARVPLDSSMLPYQLSKIYVDIWRAAQLLSWDRKTRNRAARGFGLVYPVLQGGWAQLGSQPVGKLWPPLLRRALDVLEQHQCLDCTICGQGALRWETADANTEAWSTDRRLRREEAACPTEEKSPSA